MCVICGWGPHTEEETEQGTEILSKRKEAKREGEREQIRLTEWFPDVWMVNNWFIVQAQKSVAFRITDQTSQSPPEPWPENGHAWTNPHTRKHTLALSPFHVWYLLLGISRCLAWKSRKQMKNQIIIIPSDKLWSHLCMNMNLHVHLTDEANVTQLQKKRHPCVCAIFILSVWVLLHVFRGHIPRLGVGILSSTVSHTELTGGPLFRLQAAGDPDPAQRPLRDLSAFFCRTTLTFMCSLHWILSSLWIVSIYQCLATSLWLPLCEKLILVNNLSWFLLVNEQWLSMGEQTVKFTYFLIKTVQWLITVISSNEITVSMNKTYRDSSPKNKNCHNLLLITVPSTCLIKNDLYYFHWKDKMCWEIFKTSWFVSMYVIQVCKWRPFSFLSELWHF